MSRRKKQPDAALEAAQNAQQAPQEIQRELWNNQFKNAAPYFDPATMEPIEPKEPEHGSTSSSCFTVVTKDRPVVHAPINAETLYGIKPDCCDIPRLLRAILDELIAHTARRAK